MKWLSLIMTALCISVVASCEFSINPSANIVFEPSSLTFDYTQVNSKVTRDIQISNTGKKIIEITDAELNIVATGTMYPVFTMNPTSIPSNTVLGENESFTIKITYSPISQGTSSADLVFSFMIDGEIKTTKYSITGNAYSGFIKVTPAIVRFDDSYIGEKRRFPISVINTDTKQLTIRSVELKNFGADTVSKEFSIFNGWNGSSQTLNPGQQFLITVEFNPVSVNSKSATLSVKIAESTFEFSTYLTGNCCDYISISTTRILPTGERGVLYSQSLSAIGGDGIYTFTVPNSNLPDGLKLVGDKIEGVLLSDGDFGFSINVTDSLGHFAYKTFQLHVNYAKLIRNPSDVDTTYLFDKTNDTGFFTVNLIAQGNIDLTINSLSLSGDGYSSGEATFLSKPTVPKTMHPGDTIQVVLKVESLLDVGRSVILVANHTGYNSESRFEFSWSVYHSYIFVIDRSGSMSASFNGGFPVYDQNGNVVPYPNRWQVIQSEIAKRINQLDSKSKFEVITFETNANTVFGALREATSNNKNSAISWIYSQSASGCTNGYDGVKAALNSYGQVDIVEFYSDGYMNTALSIGCSACNCNNITNRMVTDTRSWVQYQVSLSSNFSFKIVQVGGIPFTFMLQLGALPNSTYYLW